MDIILIRHGESEDNVRKVFSRDSTVLTENGIRQIEKTREKLQHYNFSKVYVSPLQRTIQTLHHLGLEGQEEKMVREMNFGIFTGLTFDEYKKKYPRETENWMSDSFNYTIPQGESISDTYKRVESFLEQVMERGEDALIVTHEGIIRLACSWVIGSVDHFFRFRADNGSITIISADEEYRYIKKLNHR